MTIDMLGIDIAKNTFQLHGADNFGKAVHKKRLARHELAAHVANLPACTVVMEACAGANYWARVFQGSGHTVKLISPQFVKPFVKTNKSDANDALAIVEAASRPSMNFVPIKQVEQQDIQSIHRIRTRIVKNRTALINEICQRILKIPGVGELTATAIVAAVPNPGEFRNGRHMSAWLGLVPRQSSSGDKQTLLGISKRGDRYLRTLLIHGARAVLSHYKELDNDYNLWVGRKKATLSHNKAAVAMANKNSRIIWSMLNSGEEFNYRAQPAAA